MARDAKEEKEIDELYPLVVILALVILTVFIFGSGSIIGGWLERERHNFVVSATLNDDSGNAIDIHGAGKVGMSGWIIFQPGGEMNLTLWAKGSGSATLIIDGKKYSTTWKAVESYGFTNDWILMKIKLTESFGLPAELNVELTEGSEPKTGSITVSTGELTYSGLELVHTGTVYKGTGFVVIH